MGYFEERAAAHKGLRREADWPRLYMLTVLMFYTGMRWGEAAGLPWRCIDFDRKSIEIRWNLTKGGRYLEPLPKNRRVRTVDMPEALASVLKAAYMRAGRPEPVEPRLNRP